MSNKRSAPSQDPQKIILKRGKRARKNNLRSSSNTIPIKSNIYYNLVKPVKKLIPVLLVKPTTRALIASNPAQGPDIIEIITLDLPLEVALEQRRIAHSQEIIGINTDFDVQIIDETNNSDDPITDREIEVISLD